MTTLVAILCLTICEERRIPLYDGGPIACVMGAQQELARLYPGWRVLVWRCEEEA